MLRWGTSDSAQGIVLTFGLALLSGKSLNTLPRNLKRFWRGSLDAASEVDEWPALTQGDGKQRKQLEHIYAGELAGWRLSQAKQAALQKWCLAVAQRRVAAIVGGQQRGVRGGAANSRAGGSRAQAIG